MSEYPNYTLEQLADLILRLDMKEGVSPAGLGALQMFAKSALENASQHSAHPTNGTLPNLEKVPYPETSATSQAESTPPIRG